jgi:hypothetical protein
MAKPIGVTRVQALLYWLVGQLLSTFHNGLGMDGVPFWFSYFSLFMK